MEEEPVRVQEEDSRGAVRFGSQPNSREEFQSTPRALHIRSNFTVEFKTSAPSGIIFYTANQRQDDFVGLFMKSGRVYFTFNCGSGRAMIGSRGTYNDNRWHTVEFSRERKEGKLVVDRTDENSGLSLGSSRTVSVAEPHYYGGLSQEIAESDKLRENLDGITTGFNGCLRQLRMYDEELGSPRSYFTGPCSSTFEPGSFFYSSGGFIVADERFEVGLDLGVSVDIRARSLSGVILSVYASNGEYLVLQMVDGSIIFNVNSGSGGQEISATWDPERKDRNKNHLCDGNWHNIKALKAKNVVTLNIDGSSFSYGTGSPEHRNTDTNDPLYIGGVPRQHAGIKTSEKYVGCIKNLMLNDVSKNFASGRQSGRVSVNQCALT